jgi:hypothetical protein
MMADPNDFEYFIDIFSMREKYDYFVELVKNEGEVLLGNMYQQYVVEVF